MPQVQLAHVPADDFDDFRFPSLFHEQHQWPRFVNRGIVSGRSVDLEPLHHMYLNDMLVGCGWGGLMDLPELAYFVSDSDLKDIADSMGDDMLNTIIKTICVDRNTPWGIARRNLEPHLSLFHVWILENILPKARHLDAVTPFECYILYWFETDVYLDLSYIIMKEIIRIREAVDDSKALGFGAMLTKIFEVFYVDLEGEITPTKGPINSIFVTSSKISEKIFAMEHDRGNPRVAAAFQQSVTGSLQTLQRRYTEFRTDSIHRTDHLAHLEATQASQANSIKDFEIEQIRLRNVLGQVCSEITRSEEHIRTSIDDLTQMFRRRFPSPLVDP
ncbi:hypothetical protein Dimus_013751 [Dionaea muscipula]